MRHRRFAAIAAAGFIGLSPILSGCAITDRHYHDNEVRRTQAEIERSCQPLDPNWRAMSESSARQCADARAKLDGLKSQEGKIHPAVFWVGGIGGALVLFIAWGTWESRRDEEREAERLRVLASLGDDDDDDDADADWEAAMERARELDALLAQIDNGSDDSDEDWDASDEVLDYPDYPAAQAQAPAPSPAPSGGSILDALKSQ